MANNPTPTNILKLIIAIHQEDSEGMHQVICYDSGVGTQGTVDNIMGGGFGEGIDINIKELYTILVLNYEDGDEVYLFGFSRGSYTVRSLCGLIQEAGLVRRDQLQYIKEAYDLYRNNAHVEGSEAVTFREAHGDRNPIKFSSALIKSILWVFHSKAQPSSPSSTPTTIDFIAHPQPPH